MTRLLSTFSFKEHVGKAIDEEEVRRHFILFVARSISQNISKVWWHVATLLIYFFNNEQSYNIYITVLRIRDVYPGSRILIFTHPGSRISDPGSRIQTQ